MIKREPASGVVMFDIITNKGERFIVCSALGHLYSLFPVEKNRKNYPVYEVTWSPRHSATVREKRRITQTLKAIENISKAATGFIHAVITILRVSLSVTTYSNMLATINMRFRRGPNFLPLLTQK